MSIRADSLAAHGAEGRNGGEACFGELQYLVNRGIEQIAARILARNLLAKFAKDGEL